MQYVPALPGQLTLPVDAGVAGRTQHPVGEVISTSHDLGQCPGAHQHSRGSSAGYGIVPAPARAQQFQHPVREKVAEHLLAAASQQPADMHYYATYFIDLHQPQHCFHYTDGHHSLRADHQHG